MREIKYRAFHKETKTMINIQNMLSFSNDGGIWINENKQYPENTFSGWIGIDFELMQYTGLKDAINKNEVYEHDIINLLGIGFLKVEWDYRDTGWICIDKHYKKRNLVHVLLNGGIRVGNIWENPELLEERK